MVLSDLLKSRYKIVFDSESGIALEAYPGQVGMREAMQVLRQVALKKSSEKGMKKDIERLSEFTPVQLLSGLRRSSLHVIRNYTLPQKKVQTEVNKIMNDLLHEIELMINQSRQLLPSPTKPSWIQDGYFSSASTVFSPDPLRFRSSALLMRRFVMF